MIPAIASSNTRPGLVRAVHVDAVVGIVVGDGNTAGLIEDLPSVTDIGNFIGGTHYHSCEVVLVDQHRVGLDAGETFVPPMVGVGSPTVNEHGNVEAGLVSAAKQIDATYETPPQYHNAMEPHAVVAAWDGDRLSIDTPSQALVMARARVAELFGIAPEKIHIRSPFLGGGFGSKGFLTGPQILGVMAAGSAEQSAICRE